MAGDTVPVGDVVRGNDRFKNHLVPDLATYQEMYDRSIADPEGFWGEVAERLDWFRKWDQVLEEDFANARIAWYLGGKLNASYNCLDRHLTDKGDQVALIFEPDDPKDPVRKYTYSQLHAEVMRFANVLKANGVHKGDRVTVYMPMIPELAVTVLACARIGAIHSVIFGGFSSDSIRDRLLGAESDFIVTSDEGRRGGRAVPMKRNADAALEGTAVRRMIVVKHTGGDVAFDAGRDRWYHEEMAKVEAECPAEEMDAEDPLFILYTSGSTGKPKGVLHTTGGYLVYVSYTHEVIFDYRPGDIWWCTADIGWITGHSYIVYGPLANGATTLMFEGVPSFPDYGRFWEVCDKHHVTQFYTAPTALRAILRMGDDWVTKHSRQSIRVLGTVGEPINPEVWKWYHEVVGEKRCPVIDTWWQTETGGILITPLAGMTDLKPGSASLPFFGIDPILLDDKGQLLKGVESGNLAIARSWPGMMRTVYGDGKRFYDTYFTTYPGYFYTGDGCRRDSDGFHWITGRVDDVLNVSGHRMGTAEIESALVKNPAVSEAAVVGYPHDLKGQGIYAFVTLQNGFTGSDALRSELIESVRSEIGPIARIDRLQWASGLPKTRSGKIMRRILRKIAEGEADKVGDISTLADPEVVEDLKANAIN